MTKQECIREAFEKIGIMASQKQVNEMEDWIEDGKEKQIVKKVDIDKFIEMEKENKQLRGLCGKQTSIIIKTLDEEPGYKAMLYQLCAILSKLISLAGNPDSAEGCRLVIDKCKEVRHATLDFMKKRNDETDKIVKKVEVCSEGNGSTKRYWIRLWCEPNWIILTGFDYVNCNKEDVLNNAHSLAKQLCVPCEEIK